ncbi:MAG TPA: restriction endonuclease subunit S [Candidatus Gallacutalibacter pullistercoris]|nr:restriction endonuclease subunit S [Candidatus Gallacutalibacter pullistercoris]
MRPEIRQRIEMIRRGEVPEGYKKKCGKVIPLTWDTSKMKEICIINPLRPEVIPEKVVFLSMTDVSEDGKILHQQKVDYQSVKQGFTPFQKGDILVAKITPCFENGKGAHTERLVTDVGFGSTEFHVLRSKINSTYTFYHTVFENFRKKLEREMTGSAGQKRVQTASLANYSIAVPPATEQQKIAAILTTQDKVIELKEKRLAEKQRQKKYLMQQLLTGKKRLPGFGGEWREEHLGKLFSERKETNCEGLEMLAITGTQGIIPRKELDLKDNSSEDKSKYLRVCIGDIGYNTMRMWQGVSAYSDYEGIVSPAYTILKPSLLVDAKYFAYLFKMPEMIFLFYRFSQGLVDDTRNLKYENFKKIKVVYPVDKSEQTAIAQVLSTADHEINLLRQDIEQEKQKKKALMQLLLTGIVRVCP